MVAVSVQVLDPGDQHSPRCRRRLVVAPDAAVHARLSEVLDPLIGRLVAG